MRIKQSPQNPYHHPIDAPVARPSRGVHSAARRPWHRDCICIFDCIDLRFAIAIEGALRMEYGLTLGGGDT